MILRYKEAIVPTVVFIEDMRDTARFSEFVETSKTPVTVTENGHEHFVVMRVKDYDALVSDREKAELMSRIAISKRERAMRSGRDVFAAFGGVRTRI